MKVYILVINDLRNVGFNAKDVEVFTDKESATERMRELYLNACEDCKIEDPYVEDSLDNQFTDTFSYVFGEYYFDIFEKELTD